MTTYSTSDLSRRSGDIIAEALHKPMTISQRNKPRLMLLSIEDYRAQVCRADPRKAGTLEDLSDTLFAEFRAAVDAYEAGRRVAVAFEALQTGTVLRYDYL